MAGWLQTIAIRYPEKVSKLILIATWDGEKDTHFLQQMLTSVKNNEHELLLAEMRLHLVHPACKNEISLMQKIQLAQSQFPTEGLINQTLAKINSPAIKNSLQTIQCPTLIIHGRQYSLHALEEQERLKNKIPNLTLVIIEDCGHLPSLERPQATTALISLWA